MKYAKRGCIKREKNNRLLRFFLSAVLLFLSVFLAACGGPSPSDNSENPTQNSAEEQTDLTHTLFDGTHPYIVLTDNVPLFTEKEKTAYSFETYAPLDTLGRVGTACACIGTDLMPTEERGNIGMIKPSGWHTTKYDIVDGKYLYNRCHLIAFMLTGENANEKNLLTGTRYMNTTGMLPFEDMVHDYVKRTANHVLYRVTPVFIGENLLAEGVRMEGYSVEDNGAGICFHVFCPNVQPGVTMDYATGESCLDGETTGKEEPASEGDIEYVLNKGTMKFHLPECSAVPDIKEQNKKTSADSRDVLMERGYAPCKLCNP